MNTGIASRILAAAVAVMALVSVATSADASTFRWSSKGDAGTLDPHAMNEELTMTIVSQIYEPLVTRDQEMNLAPALAVSWEAVEPTRWHFKLRGDVTFQDGTPFTADDVAFSIDRARLPVSPFRPFVDTIEEVRVIGPLDVEIVTQTPDPILVPKLTSVLIMSKAWAEANDLRSPQDMATKTENYATRNTNGTGPYQLKLREPDVQTELELNPNWWGELDGNVTNVIYRPLTNDATRVAALLSGELDLVIDPPLQDVARLRSTPDLKVLETSEFRTMFFGMDFFRDELLYSDVKGANPFKDRRVRQALYQSIDIEAIHDRIMRGFSTISGVSIAPGNTGWSPDLDVRRPYDVEAAKALLAEAGYPDGFGFTMDCSNNRYIADEQICNAVANMWARIGIRAKVNATPRQVFFPKTYNLDVSLYLLGINSPFMDAAYGASIVLGTRNDSGSGLANYGGYSNPEIDALLESVSGDMNPESRTASLKKIFEIEREDIAVIPLHHQVLVYATRDNVSMIQRSDNRVEIRWVSVD